MVTLTRFFLCAVVASGLLVSVVSISPEWFASTGLDVWSLPQLHAQLAEAQARQAVMETTGERVRDRLARKRETAVAVLKGQLSLFEAAAEFGEINRQEPQSMSYLQSLVQGGSDEEKLCRQVIEWASSEASCAGSPREGAALAKRLEAQLTEHLAKHGKVILPTR